MRHVDRGKWLGGWAGKREANRDAPIASRLSPLAWASDERGVALLTAMLLLIVLTIIGIASISVTGLENRMAGFGRTGEAGGSAAEACVGTAVKIIQDTIDAGTLPIAYRNDQTPAGPVPATNATLTEQEIMGQSDNNGDGAETAPNTQVTLNNFTVFGDIDRLYVAPKAGGSMQMMAGYEGAAGGTAGGGVDIMYRIDCLANNPATGTRARITAVYACTATGESCQRKI